MRLWLQRINGNTDTTIGVLRVDSEFECFTLEDEARLKKVKGETRIPAGVYEIKKRRVVSPMTERYRERFDFFDFHLHIQDVPGFEFVYIHIGNDDDDTEGCLLVGDHLKSNRFNEDNNLGMSSVAFARLYKKVSMMLEANQKVLIKISDQ